MTLDIQVLAYDMLIYVVGLNWLVGSETSHVDNLVSNGNT